MNVKVYSAPWCPWCSRAKTFLNENGVKFTEADVDKDPAALSEMMEKSGQSGIPVIDVNGEIVVGFDQEKLSGLLGIRRKNKSVQPSNK